MDVQKIIEFISTSYKSGSMLDIVDEYGYGHASGFADPKGRYNEQFYCGGGFAEGEGDGRGRGEGGGRQTACDITEFEGQKVYIINYRIVTLDSIHKNIAKGSVILFNSIMIPCYIVRVKNYFSFGLTVKSAYRMSYFKYFGIKMNFDSKLQAVKRLIPSLDTYIHVTVFLAIIHVFNQNFDYLPNIINIIDKYKLDIRHDRKTLREFCRIFSDEYHFTKNLVELYNKQQ